MNGFIEVTSKDTAKDILNKCIKADMDVLDELARIVINTTSDEMNAEKKFGGKGCTNHQ